MKKSERFGMRVTSETKENWEEAAEQTGLSLSAWVTAVLDYGAGQIKRKSHSIAVPQQANYGTFQAQEEIGGSVTEQGAIA